MDSPLAEVALKSGFSATEVSVRAEHDRLLEKLNRTRFEKGQLKKLKLNKDTAMKDISTCLLDMDRKVVTTENEKRLLAKSNAGRLSLATREEAKNARRGGQFYAKFSFYVLEICSSCMKKRSCRIFAERFLSFSPLL